MGQLSEWEAFKTPGINWAKIRVYPAVEFWHRLDKLNYATAWTVW